MKRATILGTALIAVAAAAAPRDPDFSADGSRLVAFLQTTSSGARGGHAQARIARGAPLIRAPRCENRW
jgi:hypothetical protein